MSHFYGNMKGAHGETTRCGTKNSGMRCYIRGWDVGVVIYLRHVNDKDIVDVYKTGGSHNAMMHLLTSFTKDGQL